MMRAFIVRIAVTFAALFCSPVFAAIDSYRYLHVTIDTPWSIFLFLLPIVLSPFILMAFLYWRFAGRKQQAPETKSEESSDDKPIS